MFVLASASPRRQELLRNAGISFVVQAADIDETPRTGKRRASMRSAWRGRRRWRFAKLRPQDVVLGADTIVVVDDAILGKPADDADAIRMLRLLSGRVHRVITAVCVVGAVSSGQLAVASEEQIASETTLVTMNELSDEEIREYVATGEPMDKAGAYAIQGMASRWIPRIEGDYSNVVGLPVALVYAMLRERKQR